MNNQVGEVNCNTHLSSHNFFFLNFKVNAAVNSDFFPLGLWLAKSAAGDSSRRDGKDKSKAFSQCTALSKQIVSKSQHIY